MRLPGTLKVMGSQAFAIIFGTGLIIQNILSQSMNYSREIYLVYARVPEPPELGGIVLSTVTFQRTLKRKAAIDW